MSNRTILESIEQELDLYEAGQLTGETMGMRLNGHIEALEGIPYSVILRMRQLRYELEVDWFAVEEECVSRSGEILINIRKWLDDIRKQYC